MAKALPKKYFVGYTARISVKKVDKWAEYNIKHGIDHCFDTWEEAWAFMLTRAKNKIEQAEKELASAKRHLAKVSAMRPEGA